MVASNWEIGPIVNGTNYSVGTPPHPYQTSDGWAFDIPTSPGSVHYVTYKYGSLAGKSHIVMNYRLEADPGVDIFAASVPGATSIGPTLYFQQSGDDWNTDGMRWWATFNIHDPITPGEYQLDIPLDGKWTSVFTMTAETDPVQFQTAKLNAERVGFTFGGGTGYGHGVYATGQARFVVTSFTIE